MERYKIFNHSSESMRELSDKSIDLVITDPPWNMGVKFGEKINLQPKEGYNRFISRIIKEMFRVIKPNGMCVIISAEKVKYDNKTTDLSKTYLKLFIEQNFNLISDIPIILNESKES
jgi:site-specific DNA-methyltransferase (adenine-specific)